MLIQAGCVKEIAGESSGYLEVPSGQSFIVRRLYAPFATTDGYVTMHVDRKTVGFYRVKGKTGGHLDLPKPGYINQNLMDFLADAGINVSIPVAEGQTFSYNYSAGNAHTVIVYDIYESGDVKATAKNGSDSKNYVFVQYMDASSYPAATGDCHLDVSLSPSEFPDFPCGKVVPARHTIKLLGLVGSPVGDAADAGNYIVTDYCKLVRDRETLFDEDRRGFPFRNGGLGAAQVEYTSNVSLIGPCVPMAVSTGKPTLVPPKLFDPPLVFKAGEELLVYLYFRLVGTKTLTAGAIDFACILDVTVE
jgi:hypothetical protein